MEALNDCCLDAAIFCVPSPFDWVSVSNPKIGLINLPVVMLSLVQYKNDKRCVYHKPLQNDKHLLAVSLLNMAISRDIYDLII